MLTGLFASSQLLVAAGSPRHRLAADTFTVLPRGEFATWAEFARSIQRLLTLIWQDGGSAASAISAPFHFVL